MDSSPDRCIRWGRVRSRCNYRAGIGASTDSGGEVEHRHDEPRPVPGSWAHVFKRGRVENIIDHHEQYDDNNRPQADDNYEALFTDFNNHHETALADTAPFDVATFLKHLHYIDNNPTDINDD